MNYLLDKAILMAVIAHTGQLDKANKPYILHPLRIMLSMSTKEEMIVGVLHDVIEDSLVTLDILQKEGFSHKILKALDTISRRKNETYDEYLKRIQTNSLACKIKQIDLQDNMRLDRITCPTERDFARIEKYKEAAKILGSAGGKKSVKSRFEDKTKKEISAIMKAVRNKEYVKITR